MSCLPMSNPTRGTLPIAALLLLLLGSSACSESPPPASFDGPVVAWTGAAVWTGETFLERDLLVADGRIVEGAEPDSIIDVSGRWIVPAFGDAHQHTFGTEYSRYYLGDFVRAGVLYGLDLTNPATDGMEMQRLGAADSLPMDLAFSHGGFSRLAGSRPHPATVMESLYGDDDPNTWSLEGDAYWSLDSVADVDRVWPEFRAQGSDVVKVYVMAMGEGPEGCGYGLCPDVLAAVVERAHGDGLRVFAHVNTSTDVEAALDAGVDALAHLPLGNDGIDADRADRLILDDDLVAEIGRRELVVTPTSHLLLGDAEGFPADTLQAELDLQRRELRALVEAGARIALSGHDWQVTSRREAEYLVTYDLLDPATVLEAWAGETPRSIFPDREVGHLGPGAEATFLILGGDPIADFSAVRDIELRVRRGEPIDLGEGEGG